MAENQITLEMVRENPEEAASKLENPVTIVQLWNDRVAIKDVFVTSVLHGEYLEAQCRQFHGQKASVGESWDSHDLPMEPESIERLINQSERDKGSELMWVTDKHDQRQVVLLGAKAKRILVAGSEAMRLQIDGSEISVLR